jgi:hypothetical protein
MEGLSLPFFNRFLLHISKITCFSGQSDNFDQAKMIGRIDSWYLSKISNNFKKNKLA